MGIAASIPQKKYFEGEEAYHARYHTLIEKANVIIWETYSEDEKDQSSISCDAATIEVDHGLLYVLDESNEHLMKLDLKKESPSVSRDETKVTLITSKSKLQIDFPDFQEATRYHDVLRGEILICSANSSQTIDDIFDEFLKDTEEHKGESG